jgi:uncharacterized membrane protein
MESQGVMIVLRLVHVLAGVVWVGAAIFVAVFLFPAVVAAGPAGGAVMRQLTQVRRLPLVLTWATWLTIGSGVLLYWRLSGGFHPAWLQSGPGLTFGLGGLAGVAAAVLGMVVNAPTAKRIGELGQGIAAAGGPSTPEQSAEMARLQGTMRRATVAGAALLVVSTIAMAVARYV